MNQGLTMVQTARAVGGLQWAVGRCFEILGLWAAEADNPSIAVSMATSSRHLGWHLDDLGELLPDSELIASEQYTGPPSPRVAAALEAIRAIPGSAERLAITHRVLLNRIGVRCVAIDRATARHNDAPLARVVGFLLADIRRDRDEGELLLDRILVDEATVNRVGERVVEAERRLVAAGGLLQIVLD